MLDSRTESRVIFSKRERERERERKEGRKKERKEREEYT